MPKGFPKNGVNSGWFKKGDPSNCAWYGRKRLETTGERHPRWKGIDADYSAKHRWIYKLLGAPTKCENCGKDELRGHKIHWASVSRKCERVVSDWVRLCVSCHKLYDLGKVKLKI